VCEGKENAGTTKHGYLMCCLRFFVVE